MSGDPLNFVVFSVPYVFVHSQDIERSGKRIVGLLRLSSSSLHLQLICTLLQLKDIRYGVVANIIASHAIARGSIPRVGTLFIDLDTTEVPHCNC